MMDRWSIHSIYRYIRDLYNPLDDHGHPELYMHGEFYTLQCWENFLIAIVLWEEIWSFDLNRYKKYNINNTMDVALGKIAKIVRTVEESDLADSLREIHQTLSERRIADYYDSPRRTLMYQLASNSLGIPYFPHPSRKEYLFIDESYEYFTRLDLIDKVDRALLEYYKKINGELGRNILSFNYPVLLDFIKKDTQTIEDEINRALALRMDKDVVVFRDQLFHIEQSIMRGDTQLLLSELKMVSDLAKDVTNKYQKRTNLGEFTIALSPSLTIPLSLGKNKKRALHATFIRRLIDFGVYERG